MDDMTYSYRPGTNQLDKVTDAAPDAAAGEYDKYNDIKKFQATKKISQKHLKMTRLAKYTFLFFFSTCLLFACNQRFFVHKNQVLLKKSGFLIFTEPNIEFINEFGDIERKKSDTLLSDFFIPAKFDINKTSDKNYLRNLLFNSDTKEGNEVILEMDNTVTKNDLIDCAGDTIILDKTKGVNFNQGYIIVVPVEIYFQKNTMPSFPFKHSYITLVSAENMKVNVSINKSKSYYSIYKCVVERLCKKEYLLRQSAQ